MLLNFHVKLSRVFFFFFLFEKEKLSRVFWVSDIKFIIFTGILVAPVRESPIIIMIIKYSKLFIIIIINE